MKKVLEVVGALILEDDKFLICQRPKNKTCPLNWEFVGGKVEEGESYKEALVRECKEELNVTLSVQEEFCFLTHEYDHAIVNLHIFLAKIIEGVPQKIEHNDQKWIKACEIDNYEFCPADKEILQKIKCSFLCKR